jgi:hypothetical protein
MIANSNPGAQRLLEELGIVPDPEVAQKIADLTKDIVIFAKDMCDMRDLGLAHMHAAFHSAMEATLEAAPPDVAAVVAAINIIRAREFSKLMNDKLRSEAPRKGAQP